MKKLMAQKKGPCLACLGLHDHENSQITNFGLLLLCEKVLSLAETN